MKNGLPLTPEMYAEIEQGIKNGYSNQQIADDLGINRTTVTRHRKRLAANGIANPLIGGSSAVPETPVGGPLPILHDPIPGNDEEFYIEDPGKTWVLSDVHFPFHDLITLQLGAAKAKREGVTTIIVNGDLLDCLGLSSKFHRHPSLPMFHKEREMGVRFFEWLRSQFPDARIIWKLGNHEERLENYIVQKNSELFGLDELTMESLLDCEKYRVEVVTDQRLIMLGRLPILHGHEYQSGISAPVNPARGVFLRGVHTVLVGHSHQKSEHSTKDLLGKVITCWSTGCCCTLKPRWKRYNQWTNGWAFIDVSSNGEFTVFNHQVVNGIVR